MRRFQKLFLKTAFRPPSLGGRPGGGWRPVERLRCVTDGSPAAWIRSFGANGGNTFPSFDKLRRTLYNRPCGRHNILMPPLNIINI